MGVKMVALVPARAGSKRVPGKNTRLLGGRPLIAWTILAALDAECFYEVAVCSDDPFALDVAKICGVRIVQRPRVSDTQPDIEWVKHALSALPYRPEMFAILRPTSPFRTSDTIRRAYKEFREQADCGDSIRAVEKVRQHPYKMWKSAGPDGFERGYPIRPLFDGHIDGTPYHSSPTQSLPTIYVQNSSLEMSWTANVEVHGTISGRKVGPFFTEGYEGFSIDYPEDWEQAERLLAAGVLHGAQRQAPACAAVADASGCP